MANENRSERRGDSIPSRIVAPVVVGIILALMVGGTSPWWWNALFPGPSAAPVTPPPTEASFLDLLQGEWTLDTWQERPGDITLYMHPPRGC